MKKLRELRRRLLFYFRRDRFDRELAAEMRFHLEMKARARMEAGAQPKQAHLEAQRQFGNEFQLKELSREMWSFRWLETIVKDLQFSLRMIRKSPVLASVVILSLALAIGANTAIFSFVDAILLKELPVKNPNELVLFSWSASQNAYVGRHSGSARSEKGGPIYGSSLSSQIFERMKQQNQTLTDLFAFSPIYNSLSLSVDNQAGVATGQYVSGGYYKGLGVNTVIGRTITDSDDKLDASPVAVITYRYWQERFGLNPAILGKPVFINGLPFTIIGVSQPRFEGALNVGISADISLPLVIEPQITHKQARATIDWMWWLRIMGRLKPGVTIEQAHANFEGPFQQSAMEGRSAFLVKYPDQAKAEADDVPPKLVAESGRQGEMFHRQDYVKQLYILLVIVGLVLLIACVNVANLLLARSSARQTEIAIRIALGAGRLRLIRQLLTESLTLALAGGLAGFILAYWTRNLLIALSPWSGESLKIDISLDFRVLGFTAAASILTGILFGIAPALKATRIDTAPALKGIPGSQNTGRSRLTLGKSLVVIQVTLSVVLLVGAGLFLRTLRNLQHVDYGFEARNLLLFDVNPSLNGYKGERLANVYQQIADRLDVVPGVQSSTITLYPLVSDTEWGLGPPKVPGAKKVPDPKVSPYLLPVRNNFFATMHIPLLFGRAFDARDNEKSPKVAIVNQAFVRLAFDEDIPIGQHVQFGDIDGPRIFEIVGIVKDSLYKDLRSAPSPMVYLPFQQQIVEIDSEASGMTYEVRSSGDPTALVPAIREAVRSIDSKLSILNVKTQTQQINEIMSSERLFAALTGALGLLVLILAGLGLYGVMSYNVARRTREIGIRMALGAGARRILGQVMRETIVLVTIGVVVGVAASYTAIHFSAALIESDDGSMLFGVTPHDPVSMALAVLFLLAAAALAGYLPARRAARVDPLVALKYD